MHRKLRIHDSHKLVQISLNFLFFGVIFFFFPFAGDFGGGVTAWDAATWLLVTGPGLLHGHFSWLVNVCKKGSLVIDKIILL
jgi:hypothetical protein